MTDSILTQEQNEFHIHSALRFGSYASFRRALHSPHPKHSPDHPDTAGLSPIHHVAGWPSDAEYDSAKVLNDLLLYYSTHPDPIGKEFVLPIPTKEEGNTVFHLAVKFENTVLVRRLIELGAKCTLRNRDGWLPLHFVSCAPRSANSLVEQLLNYCPQLKEDTYQISDDHLTPVQAAAQLCCYNALVAFRDKGFNFSSHNTYSVKELVINRGDSEEGRECLHFLCTEIDKERDHEVRLREVHTAVKLRAGELIRVLLESNYVRSSELLNLRKECGSKTRTLHWLSTSPAQDSVRCAKVLLDLKYQDPRQLARLRVCLAKRDSEGKTALDICISKKNVGVAAAILMATYEHDQKPDSDLHYWLDHEVLHGLYKHIPQALLPVLAKSYESQIVNRGSIFDYSVITGMSNKLSRGRRSRISPCMKGWTETAHLYKVVKQSKSVQRELLQDRLALSFIDYHWAACRVQVGFFATFQITTLIFYLLCLHSMTLFMDEGIMTMIIRSQNASLLNDDEQYNDDIMKLQERMGYTLLDYTTQTMLFVIFLQELYQLCYNGFTDYMTSTYNLSQIFFVPFAIYSLYAVRYQHESAFFASLFGVGLAFLVFIFQIRHLPPSGTYVAIFTQVFKKSAKIFLVLCLPTLVAFLISFEVLVSSMPLKEDSKEGGEEEEELIFRVVDPLGGIVKLLAMMTGELTFNELISGFNSTENVRYYTVIVVIAVFAFVATIVIFNLLVAMAVEITKDVREHAKVVVARCRLEEIHTVQSAHPTITKCVNWVYTTIMKCVNWVYKLSCGLVGRARSEWRGRPRRFAGRERVRSAAAAGETESDLELSVFIPDGSTDLDGGTFLSK